MRQLVWLALLFSSVLIAQEQVRMQHPGTGVNGGPRESSFLVHRLGNDHAEGITTSI